MIAANQHVPTQRLDMVETVANDACTLTDMEIIVV